MKELNCPTCPGRRAPRQLLCPTCWHTLPGATRNRLTIRDPRTPMRRQQLRAALADKTPLPLVRVSR
ncbi:hypothetical protein [Streptomyces pseudovenezuelae]|uniref:hypothetical protein n=1 Tax=Streptomyces pseudovenezuelae TaxID=67350 RepID=UPI002E37BD1E|nr:hypothetical protein [Streptomyces pseudovenezuelae]